MPKKSLLIPVFKAEQEDGIAKAVQSNASIAYITQLQDSKLSQEVAKEFFRSVSSEVNDDQFDLFYLNTILVTTGINKNYDAFLKEPTWQARYSPIHKQFNLEHDQSKIIGHMTSAVVVDEKYNVISDNTVLDDIPDKFHILTGAVIYRALADEKAQEDIEKIIDEIGKGEWFVSMECLFRGFDYAVVSASGEQKVIPRNEETAWLTKHLRQYGGTGSYNGFTLGRVLKHITFSGKGLVRRPANPDSIIFNENVSAFRTSFANLGYINASDDSTFNSKDKESVPMAQDETQVKALEQKVAELTDLNSELTKKLSAFESSASKAKMDALESDVQAKDQKISQLETELKNTSDAKAEVEKNLKNTEDRLVKAEKDLSDVRIAELTRSRVEKLVKVNAPKEEADQIVAMFSDKTEEQFDALVGLFAGKWKKEEPTPTSNSDIMQDAQPQKDVSLATDSVDENVENRRKAMAAVMAHMLSNEEK